MAGRTVGIEMQGTVSMDQGLRRVVTGVAAAIAMGVAGAAVARYLANSPSAVASTLEPAARDSDRLELTVDRDGNALLVRWPSRPGADHGLLQISDGKQQSQLKLDSAELGAGLLTYWSEAKDVTFSLEMMGGGRKWSGTVRAAQLAGWDEPKPSPFVSPAGGGRRLKSKGNSAVVAPPQAPILKPISFRPQVAVVAEPVRKRGVLSRIPLLRRLDNDPQAFVPPKPLHQERPPLGGLEKGESTRSVGVDVQVNVSESGKVQSAKLLSRVDAWDDALASGAVSAARQWKFAPASLGGESVPGEVILHFRFEPGR